MHPVEVVVAPYTDSRDLCGDHMMFRVTLSLSLAKTGSFIIINEFEEFFR